MPIDVNTLLEIAEQKRETAIIAAEASFGFDMALISMLGGSALDALAEQQGQGTDETSPVQDLNLPKEYTDAVDLRDPISPIDFAGMGFKVTIEEFPGVGHPLTFIDLNLNGIESSHVAAFACDVKQHPMMGDTLLARIFIRYKSGGIYRYMPHTFSRWLDMVGIAQNMMNGEPAKETSLTVGQYVERVIKKAHEADRAICEFFDAHNNVWALVLNKRQKAEAKNSGDNDRVWHEAEDYALQVYTEMGDYIISEGNANVMPGVEETPAPTEEARANVDPIGTEPETSEGTGSESSTDTSVETPAPAAEIPTTEITQVEEQPAPVEPESVPSNIPVVEAQGNASKLGENAEF